MAALFLWPPGWEALGVLWFWQAWLDCLRKIPSNKTAQLTQRTLNYKQDRPCQTLPGLTPISSRSSESVACTSDWCHSSVKHPLSDSRTNGEIQLQIGKGIVFMMCNLLCYYLFSLNCTINIIDHQKSICTSDLCFKEMIIRLQNIWVY